MSDRLAESWEREPHERRGERRLPVLILLTPPLETAETARLEAVLPTVAVGRPGEQIAGGAASAVALDPELVQRATTGPAPRE